MVTKYLLQVNETWDVVQTFSILIGVSRILATSRATLPCPKITTFSASKSTFSWKSDRKNQHKSCHCGISYNKLILFIIYRVTIIISQEIQNEKLSSHWEQIQNKKLSSHREQLFWPLYPVAARWTNPQMTWLRLHWGCPAWKNKASKCLVSNVFITKIIYHQKWFNRKSSFLNSKNWFEKILVKSYINTSPLIASVLSSSAPYACKNKLS